VLNIAIFIIKEVGSMDILLYFICCIIICREMVEQVKNGHGLFQLAMKEQRDKVLSHVDY